MIPVTCTLIIPTRNQHARIVAQLLEIPKYIMQHVDACKYYYTICGMLRTDQVPHHQPEHDPQEVILANAILLAYKYLGAGTNTPFLFHSCNICNINLTYFPEPA